MKLFLLIFLTIYGAAQAYFFLKVKAGTQCGIGAGVFLGLFLCAMTAAPAAVRMLEHKGLEALARATAYAGYFWMGFIFLFLSASLLIDLYHGVVSASGLIFRTDLSACRFSGPAAFLLPLAWGLGAGIYGFFEAGDIRVEQISIFSSRIPESVGRVSIAQISDVHLGLIVREKRLQKILRKVREANPDILVSTGDLVDGQIDGLARLAGPFREINPRFGKLAVTGNHELYAGLRHSLDFMSEAGFKVLRGEEVIIPGVIAITGVDDPVIRRSGGEAGAEGTGLTAGSRGNIYSVLLKHRPVVSRESSGRFDLQLSGHVHKGQIFPFNLLTWLFFPVKAGLNRLPGNILLYVNRGTGTWGPPIRFLAPPEVTVIELMHAPSGRNEKI